MKLGFNSNAQSSFERDKCAKEWFTSPDFVDSCRRLVRTALRNNKSYTTMCMTFKLKPEDMADLNAAFAILQKEFPDLNHIRLSATRNIILDTKPKNILRQAGQDISNHIFYGGSGGTFTPEL